MNYVKTFNEEMQPTGVEEFHQKEIEALIPHTASPTNKLVDTETMAQHIATSSANFQGTYSTLAELEAVTGADENDYGYVEDTDASGNPILKRYKYNGSAWIYEFTLANTMFNQGQWNAVNSGITAQLVAQIGQGGGGMVEKTWAELKALRDNGELQKGTKYRIVDFCTQVGYIPISHYDEETEEEFEINLIQSAQHPFDIIVEALSNDTLSENAQAIKNEDDVYFKDCNLCAWELKYCLDNDRYKFNWAPNDNIGKGVIYYMKDENGNECDYDFKNIKYARTSFKGYNEEVYIGGLMDITCGYEDALLNGQNDRDYEYVHTFAMYDNINVSKRVYIDASIQQVNRDEGYNKGKPCERNIIKSSTVFSGMDIDGEWIEFTTLSLPNITIQQFRATTEGTGREYCVRDNYFSGNCSENTIDGFLCLHNKFNGTFQGNYLFGKIEGIIVDGSLVQSTFNYIDDNFGKGGENDIFATQINITGDVSSCSFGKSVVKGETANLEKLIINGYIHLARVDSFCKTVISGCCENMHIHSIHNSNISGFLEEVYTNKIETSIISGNIKGVDSNCGFINCVVSGDIDDLECDDKQVTFNRCNFKGMLKNVIFRNSTTNSIEDFNDMDFVGKIYNPNKKCIFTLDDNFVNAKGDLYTVWFFDSTDPNKVFPYNV